MKIKVIFNPYANRWHAKDKLDLIKEAFTAVNIDADIHVTQAAGEGTAVARSAVGQFDAVVAAGGDGTINEVINGLIQAAGDGRTMPFGIIPIGTANDLSDTLPLPRDLTAVAQNIATGHTRQIDAGRINNHYFVNNCALYMEPMVTLENTKIKHLSGNLRYAVSLMKAIAKLQAWQMKISFDDKLYEGLGILLSVCNGPRTGGLFKMAPQADFADGYFDYVFAPDLSRATVLTILPRLLNGTHINHPKVVYGRAQRIIIECNPGTPIHADGELIAEAETKIDYELLPGKMTILAPTPISDVTP